MDKSIKIIILFIMCTVVMADTNSDIYAQSKGLSKIATKVFTKSSAKAVKQVGKEASKKSNAIVLRNGIRIATKKEIKALGYKSFISFSNNESKRVIRLSGLNQIPSNIKRKFTFAYTKSINDVPKKLNRVRRRGNVIPIGKKSIDVKWDPQGPKYVPAFDGDNLSLQKAMQLRLARRKAISPYNQFPTLDQLKNYDKKVMNFGKDKSERILKDNMLKAMDPEVARQTNAFGGIAAHHLIPGKDPNAKAAREILKKFDIDINGPENGIFLPTDKNSIYKGTIHNTSHDPSYCKYVYLKIKNCKNRDEVVTALNKVKHELYEGKIKLKSNSHMFNTNSL